MKRKIIKLLAMVSMLILMTIPTIVRAETTIGEASVKEEAEEKTAATAFSLGEVAAPAPFALAGVDAQSTDNKCGDNAYWTLEDGVLTITGTGPMYDIEDITSVDYWRPEVDHIEKVVISDGITRVGGMAFWDCLSLTQVEFGNTVESIGYSAFFNCPSLEAIILPDSVKTVEIGAFADCVSATIVDLGSLETLDDYAFQSVPAGDVVIPATLVNISVLGFFDAGVTSYAVEEGHPYFVSVDGVLYTADGALLGMYPAASPRTSYVVPDSVAEIGDCAFLCAENLQSIDLGNVVYIGESAFQECGLTEVIIPDSVESVGDFTFYFCPELQKVTIGSGLDIISYQMFYGCDSLTDVQLSEGLLEIDAASFLECNSLAQVTIPKSVQYIGEYAFPTATQLNFLNDDMISFGGGVYFLAEIVKVSGSRDYSQAYAVLDLVNKERNAAGLPSLQMDQSLLESAMIRSAEIALYFSHTRPTGLDCYSINEKMSGENIAMLQADAAEVMDSWMNSEGHRANILTEDFVSIGIGCFVQDGKPFWVQCFGRETADTLAKPANREYVETIPIAMDLVSDSSCEVLLEHETIGTGNLTQAGFRIVNPGFPYITTMIMPESVTWSSTSERIVRVHENGIVEGISGGVTNIKGSLGNGTASKVITVYGTSKNPFVDIKGTSYYYDPVLWAVENGITTGRTATEFRPLESCTRAQIVTFLWRGNGCPEPTTKSHPFTDVPVGAYYEKAVMWAVENGITEGRTATEFRPSEPCTRGQIVTFLWRAMGEPQPTGRFHPFTDVPADAYYEKAVIWAVENGITTGRTETTFCPKEPCTRAQIVTFLYRTYN